jgi:hypothetical protein
LTGSRNKVLTAAYNGNANTNDPLSNPTGKSWTSVPDNTQQVEGNNPNIYQKYS